MRGEADRAFKLKHSVLIFVHKMLVENEEGLLNRTRQNLEPVEDATLLIGFLHRNIGFFLVPQNDKIDEYCRVAKRVEEDWPALKVVVARMA